MRTCLAVTLAVLGSGCGTDGRPSTSGTTTAGEGASGSTATMTQGVGATQSGTVAGSATGADTTAGSDATATTNSGSSDTGNGPDPMLGQLIVDPEYPAWMRYEGGGSHFLCGPGDPEDFLYRGSENPDGTRDGDQQEIIDTLAPTGANGLYFQVVRSHGGDGDASHNPFMDHGDPGSGVNVAMLDQWDGWFTALNDAGVVLYLFIYDDSADPFGGDTVSPDELAFIEAIVDRFETHPLLVWVVAEEYAEAIGTARASAIAQAITTADDFDHPIGVHHNHGLVFDFADDANIDQFTMQYNVDQASALHDGVTQAFADAAGTHNLNMSEAANYGTGATARAKSWAAAMGGAYVMILGQDVVSTPRSDLEDCGRLVDFFEPTRFSETTPRDDLALGDTQYVLAAPPDLYIAYTGSAAASMGLAQLSAGDYAVRWFDPITGASETSEVSLLAADAYFEPPLGFGPEVALYLERQ